MLYFFTFYSDNEQLKNNLSYSQISSIRVIRKRIHLLQFNFTSDDISERFSGSFAA